MCKHPLWKPGPTDRNVGKYETKHNKDESNEEQPL